MIFVKELKFPFQIHYDISSQNDDFPKKNRLRRTKIMKPTNIIISVPNEVTINTTLYEWSINTREDRVRSSIINLHL